MTAMLKLGVGLGIEFSEKKGGLHVMQKPPQSCRNGFLPIGRFVILASLLPSPPRAITIPAEAGGATGSQPEMRLGQNPEFHLGVKFLIIHSKLNLPR